MKELSLHILDIAQNSISAGATLVEIEIKESVKSDFLEISVNDDGCGMSEEFVKNVTDPFTTTRTTRKVGMGIPLFKLAAQQAGGDLTLWSQKGVGTKLSVNMSLGDIDRSPIGDMAQTVVTLVSMNETVDFLYKHSTDSGDFELDTRQIKEIMQGVPLSDINVVNWIKEYINENLDQINAQLY